MARAAETTPMETPSTPSTPAPAESTPGSVQSQYLSTPLLERVIPLVEAQQKKLQDELQLQSEAIVESSGARGGVYSNEVESLLQSAAKRNTVPKAVQLQAPGEGAPFGLQLKKYFKSDDPNIEGRVSSFIKGKVMNDVARDLLERTIADAGYIYNVSRREEDTRRGRVVTRRTHVPDELKFQLLNFDYTGPAAESYGYASVGVVKDHLARILPGVVDENGVPIPGWQDRYVPARVIKNARASSYINTLVDMAFDSVKQDIVNSPNNDAIIKDPRTLDNLFRAALFKAYTETQADPGMPDRAKPAILPTAYSSESGRRPLNPMFHRTYSSVVRTPGGQQSGRGEGEGDEDGPVPVIAGMDDEEDEDMMMSGEGLLRSANKQYPDNVPYVQDNVGLDAEIESLTFSRKRHLQPGMKEDRKPKFARMGMYRNFRRPGDTISPKISPIGGSELINQATQPRAYVISRNVNGLPPPAGVPTAPATPQYDITYGRFPATEQGQPSNVRITQRSRPFLPQAIKDEPVGNLGYAQQFAPVRPFRRPRGSPGSVR